jgi:hypothetical protein
MESLEVGFEARGASSAPSPPEPRAFAPGLHSMKELYTVLFPARRLKAADPEAKHPEKAVE